MQSINELADIFKDLAQLVVEQGSMLDRIDYNIELTAQHIEKGAENLVKAEKYVECRRCWRTGCMRA